MLNELDYHIMTLGEHPSALGIGHRAIILVSNDVDPWDWVHVMMSVSVA